MTNGSFEQRYTLVFVALWQIARRREAGLKIGWHLFLGEIVLVGADRVAHVDVRVLSATHKDLKNEVKAGRFREDLYYRLVVISARMPALRERRGDVSLLALHFLDLYCERFGKSIEGFTEEALLALERYAWPGNVRELENEMQRIVVLAEPGSKIRPAHLSAQLTESPAQHFGSTSNATTPDSEGFSIPSHLSYDQAVVMLERQLLTRALQKASGVAKHAAPALGIERTRFIKLKQRLGVSLNPPLDTT